MKIEWDTYWEQVNDIFFQALDQILDIDREMFIQSYKEKYCIHCGSKNSNCKCWNDE